MGVLYLCSKEKKRVPASQVTSLVFQCLPLYLDIPEGQVTNGHENKR